MSREDTDNQNGGLDAEEELKYDPSKYAPPEECTSAGLRFFEAADSTMRLLNFFINLTLQGDFVGHVLKQALGKAEESESANDYKDLTPIKMAQRLPGPRIKFLRKHTQELLQTILCRLVDNFTTYLSEIVRESLASKPEMLKSKEKLEVEYVLKFESKEDLIQDLVDQKVASLSYRGFSDLYKWMTDRLGIEPNLDREIQSDIIELLETRNAIVHNRGCVGAKYLRQVENSRFELGKLRKLEANDVLNAWGVLHKFVGVVDTMIAEKLGLQRQPHLKLSDSD